VNKQPPSPGNYWGYVLTRGKDGLWTATRDGCATLGPANRSTLLGDIREARRAARAAKAAAGWSTAPPQVAPRSRSVHACSGGLPTLGRRHR
jgi:hypothetical protein